MYPIQENTLSRYPGSQPFTRAYRDLYFGREQDVTDLYRFILVNKIVVLHGKSGMGKTSLLNAGVLPKLEEKDGFLLVPIRFFSHSAEHNDTPRQIFIHKMQELGGTEPLLPELENQVPEDSLWQYFKALEWAQREQYKGIALVFDQFEELFTYPEGVDTFSREFAELVNNRMPEALQRLLYERIETNPDFAERHAAQLQCIEAPLPLKIVLSIRSDRMSLLDRLSPYLPNILKNCYELAPLTRAQAKAAIVNPAAYAGVFASPTFAFENNTLEEILHYLSKNGKEPVETTVLQVLCQYAETKVRHAGQVITRAELGNLETIYENYYDSLIEALPAHWQLPARRLVEDDLIDEKEERRIPLYPRDIDRALLQRLVDVHLLRAEQTSSGGYTYELSHDTLVAPILRAKRKRRAEEEQAEALATQEAEAARQREAEERTRKERERQRNRWFAILAGVLALLAMAGAVYGLQQAKRANQNAALAQTQRDRVTALLDSVSLQKQIVEQALQEAKDARRDAELQRDNANTQRLLAQANEQKARDAQDRVERLQREIRTVLSRNSGGQYAYVFYKNSGINNFKNGKYSDALNSFANAQILQNNQEIGEWMEKANTGVRANEQFYAGNLNDAKATYEKINDVLPNNFCDTQLKEIERTWRVWNEAIAGRKVTEIDALSFSYINLKTLPAELGQLTNLTTLDLRANELKSLPPELGKLMNLTTLDLSENQLTSLPPELGKLMNLTTLNLSENQLTNLPPEVGKLTNLTYLDLVDNRLTSLPPEVGKLTNLTNLYLSSNQLTSLPPELGKLTNLTSLDLSKNRLTSLPPELGKLTNLTELGLSFNQLTSLPPKLGKLTNLTELGLSFNQLTSLPPELGQLTNLTTLSLFENQLTSLPPEFARLKKLRILFLDNDKFTQAERTKIRQWFPDCKIRFE